MIVEFHKGSMRPYIMRILRHQSPLHVGIIHGRIEQMLGRDVTEESVKSEIKKMREENLVRKVGMGIYARVNK